MRPMMREHGPPTKSSWMFLGVNGGPCDLSCHHCFYANAEEYAFYDLESLLLKANKFRHYYGLEATDITGGEPSIYTDPSLKQRGLVSRKDDGRNQHLEALVEHCANIGLAPSIITHGGNNTEAYTKAIEDVGLDCWELSLHGLGRLDDVDHGVGHKLLVVGHGNKEIPDHFASIIKAASYTTRPIRWNCSVTGHTYTELGDWSRFLVDRYPATVANFIAWMAYDTWGNENHPEWQMNYTDYAPHIAEAVQTFEKHGWECNVRYFPLCIAREYGFAANTHQHYQIQTDPWEWDIASTQNLQLKLPWGQVRRNQLTSDAFWGIMFEERIRQCDAYARGRQPQCPPCQDCAARKICEGPDLSYVNKYGTDWLSPIKSEEVGLPPNSLIVDVNHFLYNEVPSEKAACSAV
jgi:hypothetical protein